MSELTKVEIEAALTNMRELARSPAKLAEMTTAWNHACDALQAHYLAMRPRPKVFGVHHMNETARCRFACAIAAGHPMAECTNLAVAKIMVERPRSWSSSSNSPV